MRQSGAQQPSIVPPVSPCCTAILPGSIIEPNLPPMTQLRRFLLLLEIPLLAIWFSLAWTSYADLPTQLPVHFNAAGVPDSYAAKSLLSWFMLPIVGLCTVLMLLGTNWLTERYPGLLNVPSKELYLALPPVERAPLTEMIRVFMAVISLSITALLALLHYDSWRVAAGAQGTLSYITTIFMIAFVAATIGGSIWFMIAFSKKARELTQKRSATRR